MATAWRSRTRRVGKRPSRLDFAVCAPHGVHSEKSAAGVALPGAYAQQCAPGDAVVGAAGVASWVRRRSSAAQAPRLRGAGR